MREKGVEGRVRGGYPCLAAHVLKMVRLMFLSLAWRGGLLCPAPLPLAKITGSRLARAFSLTPHDSPLTLFPHTFLLDQI